MILQKLFDFLSAKKIELSEEEKKELEKLDIVEPPANDDKNQKDNVMGITEFQSLKAELTALSKALAEEKAARDALTKSIEEKAKAEAKAKIDETIKKMKESGKLAAQDQEREKRYRDLLEKDFDGTLKIIEDIPAKQNSQQTNQQQSKHTSDKLLQLDKASLIEQAKAAFKQS